MNLIYPTVLHVEDDPGDQELLQHACKAAKVRFTVQGVPDGDVALEYLGGSGPFANRDLYPMPKLILLDLKMPRKNGMEVLRWVRAQPDLRGLPIVVFTASNNPTDVQRAYESGANSFIVKPTAYTDLVEVVTLLQRYWFEVNEPLDQG